jgi:hypothetical protein
MQRLSRRRALQLGGLGLASTAVGAAGLTWRTAAGFTPTASAALVEPPTLASAEGLLQVRLEAAAGPVQIAGRPATALSYNGGLPGPTLRLQPGDRLQVQLVNRLPDPTNLHVHGLHVSPEGNSDNPFVRIDPGTTFDYDYQLPDDHPPGVYWYHPHHHGMVADQIFGGLYGAIIVGDPEGSTGSIPVTRERVLVVSDISLDGAGTIQAPAAMARMRGREGNLVLVNGQARPTMTARPGERERWRIINACATFDCASMVDSCSSSASTPAGSPHPVTSTRSSSPPGTGPTSSSPPPSGPASCGRCPTTGATRWEWAWAAGWATTPNPPAATPARWSSPLSTWPASMPRRCPPLPPSRNPATSAEPSSTGGVSSPSPWPWAWAWVAVGVA